MTAAAEAQQQTGSIRGVIYDADFKAPLALTQVTVSETGQKITATDQGNYVIEDLPPGSYTLIFYKDGYTRQVKTNVVVSPGKLTDLDASLSGEFAEMEEFVVQDVRIGGGTEEGLLILRQQSPALIDSISAELLSKSGAGNAADALKLISGTTVQEGKFAVVRGLPDRYVNSQLNGVRLPSADDKTRAVELDQFPSSVIDSVQVSKTFTPDQQGDASGGAVNVVLKGIPDENIFQFTSSATYNTNSPGKGEFLTYKGGGVNFWGFDDGGRDVQPEFNLPDNNHDGIPDGSDGRYNGAVGVSRGDEPIDYKWALTTGGKYEFENGAKIGGLATFFYEQDSSYYENGVNDTYSAFPGAPVTPTTLGSIYDQDFNAKTALYDVTKGTEEVKWGGLGVAGIEWAGQELKVAYLYTRSATDTAVLQEDTRGNAYFYPTNPGTFDSTSAVPYLRTQSLVYQERTTQSLQISGKHELPMFEFDQDMPVVPLNPVVDWTYSQNKATFDEPDKRFFSTTWVAIDPDNNVGYYSPYRPGSSSEAGNLYRIFRSISETDRQYQINLKLPFRQWTETEGYVKFGLFSDHVERTYNQDSFYNSSDNPSYYYPAGWDDYWSDVWSSESHYMTPSYDDIDYTGQFDVNAWYWMVDLPLVSNFKLIGGLRYENTEIKTQVQWDTDPSGEGAIYYRPLPFDANPTAITDPSEVNVNFMHNDVLPSIGFAWDIIENLTLRGTYAETVARQTFRELTPIRQQEYFGDDIFVGNPTLQMASLKNYDLRLDYKPTPGSLYSVSYFYKDIKNPIEYIQRVGTSSRFITPVNYPKGNISGIELEVRQDLGAFWEDLNGLSIGGNATLIDSEVTVSDYEIQAFSATPFAPITKRPATNAPEYLYNIYGTYSVENTGTEFALFYTVRGDTLIAGAGASGQFIPPIYEKEYGTLNLSITQKLGEHIKFKFQAKNLLDPDIQTVYRYQGQDTVKTSYRKGIDLSFGISAEFKF